MAPRRGPHLWLLIAAGGCLAVGSPMAAAGQAADSVTLAPGPQYRADLPLAFLGSWVYGKRYRTAWTTPISMLRFDPARFRGGVRPVLADTGVREGFHYFIDGDRELWTFRTFDPNLSAIVPPGMRKQAVTGVLEDLASATLPGAVLVGEALAAAAGTRVPATRMVSWDKVPGYLYPGVETARLDSLRREPVLTTSALFDRMTTGTPVRLDASDYLKERLFDIYVGHWDLTPQSWLWVPDASGRWVLAPRPREGAFARYDGLITLFTTAGYLRFPSFGPKYDRMLSLSPQLRIIDRRILTSLPDPVWDSVATTMAAGLTDAVIARAVRQLPPAYHAGLSEHLASDLRARRDQLPAAATRYREILLNQADVYGTSGADTLRVLRDATGHVTVLRNDTLVRRFAPKVTSYLHLYPLGGPDQVSASGPGSSGPVVQIAGSAELAVADSSRGRLELFSPDSVRLTGPGRIRLRHKVLDAPRVSDSLREDTPPPPGPSYSPVLWLDITSELGIMLGGGVKRTVWSPEYVPWRGRTTLRAGYSTAMNTGGVELTGQWRLAPAASPSIILNAKYSGMENLNYFGYGNDAPRDESREDSYYWASQTHLILAPGVRLPVSTTGQFDLALIYKNVSTTDDTTRFIVQQRPFGIASAFNQLGAQVTLALDTRDFPMMASRGIRLEASGTAYPGYLDAVTAFGKVRGAMSGAFTPAGWTSLTLAGRATAEWAWGEYPVHEAAYLGGSSSLRSHKKNRYSGDAAFYANLDARLKALVLPIILRLDAGVYGLADAGRVYLEGETSNTWHYSAGGGIWVATADRSLVGRMELATGDDGVGFRFGTNFKF